MPFDFKKEYKEFYMPKQVPAIVTVPPMNYIAVRGKGNPNDETGEYKEAVGLLYAVAYTLKMSAKSGYEMKGFFDYVVPPLEGLWWQRNSEEKIDYSRKDDFNWVSMIRLPDFVSPDDVEWAKQTASEKKGLDCSKVEFMSLDEGLCVQIMHVGSYDSEPETVKLMDDYLEAEGYEKDINDVRRHHEIYLSDPRKADPSKMKTVIRHPIRKR